MSIKRTRTELLVLPVLVLVECDVLLDYRKNVQVVL